LLCAWLALSSALAASDGKASASDGVTASVEERGVPALFAWGDVDGDARLDLAAVSVEGALQLLVNAGEGRFEDVTKRMGLSGVGDAALAVWADYDGDGRLDLFVGARGGASLLFHNEGGVFAEVSAASGLMSAGAVRSAQWFDHDDDGRLDLFVVTAEKNELFRGLAGGFFEPTVLPFAGAPTPGEFVLHVEGSAPVVAPRAANETGGPSPDGGPARTANAGGAGAPGGSQNLGLPPDVGSVTPISVFSSGCANSIRDQANPSTCLTASTTPTLGRLYPISSNLFVAVTGDVGIGTTTPSAKLDVAGTARITDTLTLAPSGDTALDVSTGSIYKGGALFIHTKGGFNNTALGEDALTSVTGGFSNTASGARALYSNTTGFANTANGARALSSNTTGASDTAIGYRALLNNTTGYFNTALGARTLENTTTGNRNTASGVFALYQNTTGTRNTASGHGALFDNTAGHANTATGQGALSNNTIGGFNTAAGYRALYSSTTGYFNTAIGMQSLLNNTTGTSNIALGYTAGYNLTTGNNNIMIGNLGASAESNTIRIGSTHTRTFIGGIRGVTTGVANAIPVLVDSAGQLGTVSSSRRFKEEIRDMGDTTERLLALRPVVFRYKPAVQEGERPLEYGLIAEEVAEVFPDLVVYDEQGEPFTVKYHLLSSMLLNELKKLDQRFEVQSENLLRLEARLAAVESRSSPAAQSTASLASNR